MSFDQVRKSKREKEKPVSIPFDQGDVFRHFKLWVCYHYNRSLNPFRSGRCLSTVRSIATGISSSVVSIPFDQGDVFRQMQNKTQNENSVSIPFDQGDVFRRNL